MDIIAVGNALTWCLFALGVACMITFSSMMYDEFVTRKRQNQGTQSAAKTGAAPIPDPKTDPTAPQRRTIRGYDSPELFREDLWLRRIAQSTEESISMEASVSPVQVGSGTRDDYKSLCALLAQYPGARCDN